MTPQEYKALEFINKYIVQKGFSPTLQEIATALGLKSKANAHRCVNALEKDGMIIRTARRTRNIQTVPDKEREVVRRLQARIKNLEAELAKYK